MHYFHTSEISSQLQLFALLKRLTDRNFKKIMIMILSTTPQIEGHTIREYKGIVTGETIIGANMFKDLFDSRGEVPES